MLQTRRVAVTRPQDLSFRLDRWIDRLAQFGWLLLGDRRVRSAGLLALHESHRGRTAAKDMIRPRFSAKG